MKREDFEKYLNKKVEIVLFDNEIVTGTLKKTNTEEFKNNPNLFFPKKYYFCVNNGAISTLFKLSCVKKIREVEKLWKI